MYDVYVVNTANHPVPNQVELTEAEQTEINDLSRRAHLRMAKVHQDNRGREIGTWYPLTDKERRRLDKLMAKLKNALPIILNTEELHFAPCGEKGSAMEMQWDHAEHVRQQNPMCLKIVKADDEEDSKLRPLARRVRMKPSPTTAQLDAALGPLDPIKEATMTVLDGRPVHT